MAPLPDPQTIYYLRNVSTGKYMQAITSRGRTYTNIKIESPEYQWKFVPDGSGKYSLQNVGNSQFLSFDNKSQNLSDFKFSSASGGVSWSVTQGSNLNTVTIMDSFGYYITEMNGEIFGMNTTYITDNKLAADAMRWISEPVANSPSNPSSLLIINKNPLPDDSYRIRSFNGKYLLTMPQGTSGVDRSPYVDKQLPKDNTQIWVVTTKPNGSYTIYNKETMLYLAASSPNPQEGTYLTGQSVGAQVASEPFQWTVETFGPGIMFFIGITEGLSKPLSIGFSNYLAEDLSRVTLEPSDNIPSQIWFFERFETATPPKFYATQILNSATSYTLELSYNNNYLSGTPSGQLSHTGVPGVTTATKFNISYDNSDTPAFQIYYSNPNSGRDNYLLASGDRINITNRKSSATKWVLLPLDDQSDETCHIVKFESNLNDPRRAFSSRMIDDVGGPFFAFDPLAEQEVMQMWTFVPS